MSTLLTHIIVAIIVIAISILYIYILRHLARKISPIKNPFSFSNKFITDTEKFSFIYVISDVIMFFIEWIFIAGFENALILRSITIVISLSVAGFFGRFRSRARKKIINKPRKSKLIKDYIGDTIPTLIFRTPIYIGKLTIFAIFGLIARNKILIGGLISTISILIFGRIGCRIADQFEKIFIKKIFKQKSK